MSISGKDFSATVVGSDDNYSGQGRIWEIAGRFNKQSRAMHYEGKQTTTRRRAVKSYTPVLLS